MLLYDLLGQDQRKVVESMGPRMCVTNVAEYFYHHERERWLPQDFPWPKPPFTSMWVEYKVPKTCWSREMGLNSTAGYGDGYTPYFGCFVAENKVFEPGETFLKIKDFGASNLSLVEAGLARVARTDENWDFPEGKYGFYGGTWYVDRAGNPKKYGREVSFRFDIGEDGKISKTYYSPSITKSREKMEEDVYLVYPVLMAFSFSNCKNIEVVEVKPPAKLNKARVRRGKRPLVSYKIINVLPFGKSYAPSSRTVESAGEGVALHIRAGNFARYGEKYGKKKLFGKYEGMYWRPQAVVGTAEAGVSVHDYNAVGKD